MEPIETKETPARLTWSNGDNVAQSHVCTHEVILYREFDGIILRANNQHQRLDGLINLLSK